MTSTRRLAWSMMGLAMALVLVSVIRAQDWESEVQAGRGKFRRIVFLDDTTGFIVGATADGKSGVILRTVDGGDSWVPVDLKRTRPLTAADCAKSVCVAVGEQGAVLRSRDSVRSWMALDGPTRRSLRGIAMLDGDGKSMVAVGDGGTVLRSTDGGGTWKSVKSGTNKHLRSVVFVDASVGWAVGDAGTILLTIDGGTTWDVQDSGVSYGLADVWMRDRSWGWAVGERGTVLSTTDGGATWQKQNFGERRFLSGVTFLDERRGFIVGSSGGIWETRDAGVTWTETESDTEMTIRDVVCSESYFCHAAGDGGTTLLFVAGAPGEDVTQRQGELPMNGGETTEDGASKPESDTGSGPDLIPDAFRIDSASGMVEVIVKNIGNQPTGPAPWAVRIAYRDSKGVVLGSEVRVPVADAAVLKNGDILAISVPGTADAVPVGAVQVVVAIETQDGVSELDGKNNVGVFTVPDILRPDFVVSELTSPNADGHLRAAIRNIGTRAWTGAIGISFTPKDATGAAAWGPITTQLPQSTQIDANGGLVHFDLPTSLEAGVVTVDVRIDTSHAAVELNEENVFSFPVPVAPLPDFVVTGLTTQPENGRLRATIQNNGSRAWSGALGIAFTPKNAAGQAQWGGIATQLPASTQISANGGTIAFDLSIAVNAAAKTVDVTIDNGNAAVEQDERNTFTFPVPKPDYVVEGVAADVATGELLVTIRNVGTDSGPGTVAVQFEYRNGEQVVGSPRTASQSSAPILLPSATQVIRIRAADAPPPGVTVVVLTVDPSNSIPELDEAQNSVTLPIPEMPLPDFVVTELTKRPDSGRLRATIRNRGSRAWSGALGISFAPKNAAGQAQWGATVTQLPTSTQLAANDGMVTFDLNVALDASARTVDVTIDNGNAAVEQDERNTFTFPVPKPDYVVEGVAADVATGELLVTIRNVGTAAGEGSVGVRFTYTDGAQTVGRNGTATQADATQLLPNATQVVRIGVADIPPPEAVSTTMTVDPNNAIPELDEQNNEASFPLPSMVYPDFVVTGLTTQPSNGRLRATIQNNGSRAWSGALGIIFTPKNAAGQAQWGGIATQLPASTQIPANGGTATFDLSVAVNAATKTVDVTIDNGNVVVEQDERNTFTFPVPKPDYVVEQAVRDPATGDLLITIRNVGTAAARGSIGVRFGYQRGSQRVGRTGTASQSNAPILLPDATQLIRIHGTNAPPPEATSATLFVDPTNIVVELDEQNTRPFSIR